MNRRRVAALAVGAALLVAACDQAVVPASPSATPGVFADRPAIGISGTWTAQNGQWTFTGSVDPNGAPTNVVL